MSAYKELPPESVSFREFEANKLWTFTQANTDVVQVRQAHQVTGSWYYESIDGQISASYIPARTLYDSIKHCYYNETAIVEFTESSPYRPSTGITVRGNHTRIGSNSFTTGSALVTKIFEPFKNFGPNSLKTYKLLGDRAVVISAPQERFGDRIKPGTVHVEQIITDPDVTASISTASGSFTLYDDKNGNLYDNENSASFSANKARYTVGNVFYEHGNIVITNTGSAHTTGSQYQYFGTGSSTYTVKFKATQRIYELEAYCTAKAGEFNMPMNPSARVSRSLQTSDPLGFVSSSDFSSYVTTVGLYDNNLNLVAVGKTAQPIRNESDLALTFVVRLDF
jgi:hypothetical protein